MAGRTGAPFPCAFLVALVALAALWVAPPARAGAAPRMAAAATDPVARLVDAWAAAAGGRAAVAGIATVHLRGVVDGHGVSGDVDEWTTAEGRHRQAIDFLGRWNVLTVYDGARGWSVDADGVRHVLRGDELAAECTDAWLGAFAWLVPERRPGTLQYVGRDAAGREERLLARPAGGLPLTIVLPAGGGLPLRFETPTADGRPRVVAPLDWRPVDGVLMPFGYRQSTGDIRDDVSVILREVRLNETPPADAFAAPPGPPPDMTFPADGAARVTVETALGRVFLPLTVDGRGPYLFLLDTAAPVSAVADSVATAAGLAVGADTTGVAAGDAPPGGFPVVTAGALACGPVTWRGARLRVEDFAGLSAAAGRRVAGRLGVDFLERCVVERAAGSATLVLHDPDTFAPPRDRVAVPLRRVHGVPTVMARLDGGVTARLIVRSGMRFPLLVAPRFGPALRLAAGAPGTRQAPLAPGGEPGGGPGAAPLELLTLGRVSSLELVAPPEPAAAAGYGPAATPAPTPALVTLPGGAAGLLPPRSGLPPTGDLGGFLGAAVLERFDLVLDLPRETLWLDPRPGDPTPAGAPDAAGVLWRALPPAYDTCAVEWVMPGGPAERAGLRAGDRLVELDGRPAARWPLDELVAALARPGRTLPLVVARDGRPLKLRLVTRALD